MFRLAIAALLITTPAHAYWECNGLLTSNNVCIGSQSNVNDRDLHEPMRVKPNNFARPQIDDGRDRYDRYDRRDRLPRDPRD